METELIKLNNLGIEEYNKGNFENALNYFKKALLIKEAPSIKNNIANTLNELGTKIFK
jgi:tetratricopeptide (TPR) repeat protein